MAAMFAPRPALFICATGDWTKEFPNVEFPEWLLRQCQSRR